MSDRIAEALERLEARQQSIKIGLKALQHSAYFNRSTETDNSHCPLECARQSRRYRLQVRSCRLWR